MGLGAARHDFYRGAVIALSLHQLAQLVQVQPEQHVYLAVIGLEAQCALQIALRLALQFADILAPHVARLGHEPDQRVQRTVVIGEGAQGVIQVTQNIPALATDQALHLGSEVMRLNDRQPAPDVLRIRVIEWAITLSEPLAGQALEIGAAETQTPYQGAGYRQQDRQNPLHHAVPCHRYHCRKARNGHEYTPAGWSIRRLSLTGQMAPLCYYRRPLLSELSERPWTINHRHPPSA